MRRVLQSPATSLTDARAAASFCRAFGAAQEQAAGWCRVPAGIWHGRCHRGRPAPEALAVGSEDRRGEAVGRGILAGVEIDVPEIRDPSPVL